MTAQAAVIYHTTPYPTAWHWRLQHQVIRSVDLVPIRSSHYPHTNVNKGSSSPPVTNPFILPTGPNPIHISGSGGSCSLASITRPSLSSGQNVFLNRPVGSYFVLSATRRSQFSPKEAMTRAGRSFRPRN